MFIIPSISDEKEPLAQASKATSKSPVGGTRGLNVSPIPVINKFDNYFNKKSKKQSPLIKVPSAKVKTFEESTKQEKSQIKNRRTK